MRLTKKLLVRTLQCCVGYVCVGVLLLTLYQGDECLPQRLKKRLHDDYSLAAFQSLPRSTTCFCLKKPPRLLLGSADMAKTPGGLWGPKPIPKPGQWQVSVVPIWGPFYLPYVAHTSKRAMHFSAGVRWDDVDNYYVAPRLAWHGVDQTP
jgi:hypothetical protein